VLGEKKPGERGKWVKEPIIAKGREAVFFKRGILFRV